MPRRTFPHQSLRWPFKVGTLNRAYDALEALTGARVGAPLAGPSGPGGTPLAYAAVAANLRLAKTTSSFTAFAGTAPGSGTVKFEWFDGTNLHDGTAVVTAYNLVPTTIATAQYVVIARVDGDWWYVVLAACGS